MTIRVLLADDHRMLREALRSILEKESDIQVVGESENGRATLKAVRDMNPDVVVVDVAMPELNGIEATVRMLDRDPRLKVVALSAHSDKGPRNHDSMGTEKPTLGRSTNLGGT